MAPVNNKLSTAFLFERTAGGSNFPHLNVRQSCCSGSVQVVSTGVHFGFAKAPLASSCWGNSILCGRLELDLEASLFTREVATVSNKNDWRTTKIASPVITTALRRDVRATKVEIQAPGQPNRPHTCISQISRSIRGSFASTKAARVPAVICMRYTTIRSIRQL